MNEISIVHLRVCYFYSCRWK